MDRGLRQKGSQRGSSMAPKPTFRSRTSEARFVLALNPAPLGCFWCREPECPEMESEPRFVLL